MAHHQTKRIKMAFSKRPAGAMGFKYGILAILWRQRRIASKHLVRKGKNQRWLVVAPSHMPAFVKICLQRGPPTPSATSTSNSIIIALRLNAGPLDFTKTKFSAHVVARQNLCWRDARPNPDKKLVGWEALPGYHKLPCWEQCMARGPRGPCRAQNVLRAQRTRCSLRTRRPYQCLQQGEGICNVSCMSICISN